MKYLPGESVISPNTHTSCTYIGYFFHKHTIVDCNQSGLKAPR